jgi:hypothetical protein
MSGKKKPTAEPTIVFGCRLPVSLVKRFKIHAIKTDKDIKALLEEVLEAYLKDNEGKP